MKQETGNKTPQSANKVSIQLSLDGHSFSVPTLPETFPGDGPVEVEVLSPRTMLVPEELFDARQAEALLSAAGLAPAPGECVVASIPKDGIVAVMAVGAEVLQQVTERTGGRARFTTPLLHTPQMTVPTVWVFRTRNLLYIKVYDGTLQLAEVIPASDEVEIRYFFERLGMVFTLPEHVLLLAGEEQKMLRKLFEKRFKQTLCE